MATGSIIVYCACVVVSLVSITSHGLTPAICPVDMVIAVDSSGSICQDKFVQTCDDWEKLKDFMIDIIKKIDHGMNSDQHRFGIIMFGSSARVEYDLGKFIDIDDVIRHIRKMEYKPYQTTNTGEGLKMAMKMIKDENRPEVTSVITVITDGKSTHKAETLAEAKIIQETNTAVIAVGVTSAVESDELRDISSKPHLKGQNYFEVPNVDELRRVLLDILITACTRVPDDNENVCPIDLVIVYDVSGSICHDDYVTTCDDWVSLKVFMEKLIERLDPIALSSGSPVERNKFALISFGSNANKEFDLKRYGERASVWKHVNTLTYKPYQETNAGAALNLARTELKEHGRENVPHVVVIITDGYSNTGPDAVEAAKALHADGARILSVGVTSKIHDAELKAMASEPRELNVNYFEVPSADTLTIVVGQVALEACRAHKPALERRKLNDPLEGLLEKLLKSLKDKDSQ